MTIQTKHFIELSDLLALRFACKNCGATLTLLLSDHKLSNGEGSPQMFLSRCPSCNHSWAEIGDANYEPNIRRATVALKRLQDLLIGDSKAPLGFDLVIEIKPESLPNTKGG
jgi:hypothetical protein